MESQSTDVLGIVPYYVSGCSEYGAEINFVPSDGFFNFGECEMFIPGGRQEVGWTLWLFMRADVNRVQTQMLMREHLTSP